MALTTRLAPATFVTAPAKITAIVVVCLPVDAAPAAALLVLPADCAVHAAVLLVCGDIHAPAFPAGIGGLAIVVTGAAVKKVVGCIRAGTKTAGLSCTAPDPATPAVIIVVPGIYALPPAQVGVIGTCAVPS